MKDLREALVNKKTIKNIRKYSDRYIVDPWDEYDEYALEHYKGKLLENYNVYILTHSEITSLIKNADVGYYSDIEKSLEIYDFGDDDNILHDINNEDLIWDDIVKKFNLKKVSPKKFM